MYHINFRTLIIAFITAVCLYPFSHAAENNLLSNVLYETQGAGVDIWAGGKSMIRKGRPEKKSSISIDRYDDILKVFILWSGEVKDNTADHKKITITCPGKAIHNIEADKAYETRSSGIIYSCFKDITSLYTGPGNYEITGLLTDPAGEKNGKPVYSVGGYAFIVVYKEKDTEKERKLRLYSGLEVLKPGEMHDMKILDKDMTPDTLELIIIGGHGLEGNGSANLLNGISISGSEDWNGSSGEYWDVDDYSVHSKDYALKDTGAVLTFDTLLQWIYPVAVITLIEGE